MVDFDQPLFFYQTFYSVDCIYSNEACEKATPSVKKMPSMWTSIYLEKKMGEKLGRSQILQRSMPEKSFKRISCFAEQIELLICPLYVPLLVLNHEHKKAVVQKNTSHTWRSVES